MPRAKRNSKILEQSQRRLEAILSIDPSLDFGSKISVAQYVQDIEQTQKAIAQYNTLLSNVDEAQKIVEAMEQKLAKLSSRLLLSIGMHYGEDSVEFMKAGGKTRASKRRVNKELSNRLNNDAIATSGKPLLTTIISKPIATDKASMNKTKNSGTKVRG
jgi:hypothetical protein